MKCTVLQDQQPNAKGKAATTVLSRRINSGGDLAAMRDTAHTNDSAVPQTHLTWTVSLPKTLTFLPTLAGPTKAKQQV